MSGVIRLIPIAPAHHVRTHAIVLGTAVMHHARSHIAAALAAGVHHPAVRRLGDLGAPGPTAGLNYRPVLR